METDDLSARISAATQSALACFLPLLAPLFLDVASTLGRPEPATAAQHS